MIKCNNCGADIEDNSKFCAVCGAQINPEAAEQNTKPENAPEEPAAQEPEQMEAAEDAAAESSEKAVVLPTSTHSECDQKTGTEKAKFCLGCGTQMEKDDVFCSHCGWTLNKTDDCPARKTRYAPIKNSTVMLTFLLLWIFPPVGFIMLLVWACGGSKYQNKRNLGRGYLLACLVVVLLIALLVIAVVLIGGTITNSIITAIGGLGDMGSIEDVIGRLGLDSDVFEQLIKQFGIIG